MRDWETYWKQIASKYKETEFLEQVGRTAAGKPKFESLAESQDQVLNVLNIKNSDIVLDLCCGNGIITHRIAGFCQKAVGVDYSESLINIAEKHFNLPNLSYYCMSILDKDMHEVIGNQFSKIFMLGSLQYFQVEEFENILGVIRICSKEQSQVLIEGIPDIERMWTFYDTEERRAEYRRRKERNEDIIGTWWNKEEIIEICNQNKFACQILPATESYAHYRFDVKLSRLD